MNTELFIISNITIPLIDILNRKQFYLEQLKSLRIHTTYNIGENIVEDWISEVVYIDENEELNNKESTINKVIHFYSTSIFNLTIYNQCIEISTVYNYTFLYEMKNYGSDLKKFRDIIHKVVHIFGGNEVIYLANNGCDKLATYLEFWVWFGKSYEDIKLDMQLNQLKFIPIYNLDSSTVSCTAIEEVVIDYFTDF